MCLAPQYMSQTLPTQPVWAPHTELSMVGRGLESRAFWKSWGTGWAKGDRKGESGMFPVFRDIGVLGFGFIFLPPSRQEPTSNLLFFYSVFKVGKEK